MIVTDYGVPLMIGGKYNILPIVMYQDVIGMLDFGKGSVIGIVLLKPAIIACALDILNRDKGNTSFITKEYETRKNKNRDAIAYLFCVITCIAVVLPIATFIHVSIVKKYPVDLSLSFDNVFQSYYSKRIICFAR